MAFDADVSFAIPGFLGGHILLPMVRRHNCCIVRCGVFMRMLPTLRQALREVGVGQTARKPSGRKGLGLLATRMEVKAELFPVGRCWLSKGCYRILTNSQPTGCTDIFQPK